MPAPSKPLAKARTMEMLHKASHFPRTSSTLSLSSTKSTQSVKAAKRPAESTVETGRHTKRVTFNTKRLEDTGQQTGLTSCLITSSSTEMRQPGGANNPAERKVGLVARTDSECQFRAPGIDFLKESDTAVTTFEVKMDKRVPEVKSLKNFCNFFPKYVDPSPFKEQATQTLYRESSAQTLAYLPEIKDKEQDEQLELFNLAALLPGDKPPGLYEVEVLERARKRWAFKKALKTNFQRQLHEARELAIKSKYKTILQAFEWERWIEREEYIQECQMTRLEIVIRMFDKREKDMHTASKTRIEMACERIEKRRQAGLKKNEVQYQRAQRRLDLAHANISRRWVKESPAFALGSGCSEFHAPKIRHGVDPARRHFECGRKAFDMRIDDLEKRVNMNNLQCPFTKLKEWSKPKEVVKEYEQNFCTDNNLQKMYESLKGLRTQAAKQKMTPKCLKRRYHPQAEATRPEKKFDLYDVRATLIRQPTTTEPEAEPDIEEKPVVAPPSPEQYYPPKNCAELLMERRQEDIENLLHAYEGTAIGWIMQFLSEEMDRLKEQRKLHFFAILAQKERWRREAAEAGLRQKENDMRALYEELSQETNLVNNDVAEEYINTILTTDMSHIAEREASEVVTELAKKIDEDIQRWLDNIKLVQTPLTFEPLRVTLRDMIFPNVDELVARHEKNLIANYIMEDVLFPRIWNVLEPFDICTTLASDFIDRLIDNDLLFFSSDSESEDARPSTLEAKAIIRKLIRQATPGRRWKTETERIIHENYNDLLDDVFNDIVNKVAIDKLPDAEPSDVRAILERTFIFEVEDLHDEEEQKDDKDTLRPSISMAGSELIETQILNLIRKVKLDNITKVLVSQDKYQGSDIDVGDAETLLAHEILNRYSVALGTPEDIYSILSDLDISSLPNFNILRSLRALRKLCQEAEKSSSLSDIGVEFEKGPANKHDKATEEVLDILHRGMGSHDGDEERDLDIGEYDADDERSFFDKSKSSSALIELMSPRQVDGSESPQPSIGVVASVMTRQSDETIDQEPGIIVDGVSLHGVSLDDLAAMKAKESEKDEAAKAEIAEEEPVEENTAKEEPIENDPAKAEVTEEQTAQEEPPKEESAKEELVEEEHAEEKPTKEEADKEEADKEDADKEEADKEDADKEEADKEEGGEEEEPTKSKITLLLPDENSDDESLKRKQFEGSHFNTTLGSVVNTHGNPSEYSMHRGTPTVDLSKEDEPEPEDGEDPPKELSKEMLSTHRD